MQRSEFVLPASDGPSLSFRLWMPETSPKGVVCLVHGLGEHTGRYEYVGRALTDAGYVLIGFDQRGHGASAGRRGVTPSFDRTMDDLVMLLHEAYERWPDVQLYLYGHSMGGNWVLNYAIRRRPQIAGVIASSPGLRAAFNPPAAKVALGRLLYRLAPDVVMPNGLELDALSRDPAVIHAYVADPLVHNKMSARLGLDILRQGQWAVDHAADFPSLPLLLVHGDSDRIASVEATKEFAGRVRDARADVDVTLMILPDCCHEPHNEPEKDDVLRFIIDWLDRHLPAS